mgnify:CR=1 FL=1
MICYTHPSSGLSWMKREAGEILPLSFSLASECKITLFVRALITGRMPVNQHLPDVQRANRGDRH